MREPEKKQLSLSSAILSYLIGWLWVSSFLLGFNDPPKYWYPLVFTVVFFLWAEWTLREKDKPMEHFFWLLCTLLTASSIALRRGRATQTWSYLALHGFAAYWVLVRAGLLTDGQSGVFLPLDLLEAGILAPFGGFFQRILRILSGIRKAIFGLNPDYFHKKKKSILISCAVILLFLPFLIAAGKLLGQADRTFQKLINHIFSFHWHFPLWLSNLLPQFLFGLPVGAYLYGLVGTAAIREAPRFHGQTLRQAAETLRFTPTGALVIVLSGFIGLYALFFAVQARHLLGAFWGSIPGTLTAAQYARDGFFQLCKVMILNFLLLGISEKISLVSMRNSKTMRCLYAALMVESLFLACTAASKLVLYIQRFGYTPLRLLSAWGILVLTAGCILTLFSLKTECRGFRKWILFSAATFTLLCFY